MLGRRDWLALAGTVGIAVGLPAVLATMSGAIAIPHNDDFDYRRIALTLATDGRLELRGFAVMSLLGQVLAVQPLLWLSGGAGWAFAASTVAFSVVGLVSAYALVRRSLALPWAAFAVLAVVAVPGFLANTTTFMTDVPAFSMAFLCLALGAAAIGPGRIHGRYLAASLAAGCLAISIRDSALAAPMAVVAVAAVADPVRLRRYVAIAIGLLLFVALIHVFLAGLPGEAELRLDTPDGLHRVQTGFSTLALCLVPALIVAIARWRSRWLVVDLVPGLALGLLVAWAPLSAMIVTGRLPALLAGNLFTLAGTLGSGDLDGSGPAIDPTWIWTAVQFAALGATILMPAVATGIAGSVLRRGGLARARLGDRAVVSTALLVVFVALTGVGLVVYGYLFTMFDRYLWPLILAASALLVGTPPPVDRQQTPPATDSSRRALSPAAALAVAAVVALGALSLLNLLASNALSAARWRLGEAAVAAGIPAGRVDGGMEWVGYYATGTATPYRASQRGQAWYTGWWPSYTECAVVSLTERDRADLVLVHTDPAAYRQFQLFGPDRPLYLYRVATAGCP